MAKGKGFSVKAGRRKARPSGARGRRARFGGRSARRSRGAAKSSGKFNLFGLNLVDGLIGGAGAVASGVGTNILAGYVPVPQLKTGAGRLALRGALTVVGAMVARKALPPKFSGPLVGGALVGLGIDVVQTFVMPAIPAPAMSGYESAEDTLAAIEAINPGTLEGLALVDGGSTRSVFGSFN